MQRSVVLAALLALGAAAAHAQCADGSPPPCRTATGAAPQRKAPPIDDRTWIVVPFDNTTGSPETEWLRTGAVNLLYLGMSRWTDIIVIDDKRVADFMREVPGTSQAKSLTASQAIAIARRAGAARVVMGDVLKLGSRTTVNATIYDVKTGRRGRSVREETLVADSILSAFTKLSQKILNVAPPIGSSSGIVGTTSVAAYQAYAEGMQALNSFALDDAQGHFNRALQLDSGFALAHAKLAVLLGWVSPGNPASQQHAEAAGRLSGGLPPREKSLIEAQVAFAHQDYVKSCNGFRALLKRDSTDTDAWYGLGDCLYHDPAMETVPGDSTKVRFRGDRNASMKAFRTALALDPTYHLAYQHMVDAYLATSISARHCPRPPACASYFSMLRPRGDSLVIEPVQLPRDSAAYRAQTEDMLRNNGRRVGLERALATTDRWLEASPNETRARAMRATILLTFGRIAAADTVMRSVAIDSTNTGFAASLGALEIQVKSWRSSEALAYYDSLRKSGASVRGGPNPITMGNLMSQASPLFGQLSVFDSLVNIGNRGAPPNRAALSRMMIRELAGIHNDSLTVLAADLYRDLATSASPAVATRNVAPILVLLSREWPASAWPRLDTTVTDPRSQAAIALQRGDTGSLRRAITSSDSLSRALASGLLPDSGLAVFAAEGYLALRDSLKALNTARFWLDDVLPFTPLVVGQVTGNSTLFVSRAVLLRADLAAALGYKAEARLWYQRFLDLWAKSDPQAAPLLERVRKALSDLAA